MPRVSGSPPSTPCVSASCAGISTSWDTSPLLPSTIRMTRKPSWKRSAKPSGSTPKTCGNVRSCPIFPVQKTNFWLLCSTARRTTASASAKNRSAWPTRSTSAFCAKTTPWISTICWCWLWSFSIRTMKYWRCTSTASAISWWTNIRIPMPPSSSWSAFLPASTKTSAS